MTSERLKQFNQIGEDVKALRRPYEAHFRELGENFQPRRSRFSQGKDHQSKESVNRKMLNSTPRLALRTMQSGVHAGITSPARPWFRLIPADPELREYEPVKEHLHAAQRQMRQLFQSSGMYTMLHILWGDLGLYGTDAAILEDDPVHGIYGQALVPGEYWLGNNGRGMIDTLYREYRPTLKQVVGKFVYKNNPQGNPDWSVVSQAIRNMWDQNKYAEKIPVRHLIMPRYERDERSKTANNKPFMSTYWEAGESEKLLGDLGYNLNPILASRWDAEGTDTYGSSPAMDALPDAKELQRKERDKAEAVRRMNRPPMNAPAEFRNSPFSLMPEAINFVADPSKGLTPAYIVNPPMADLRADIEDTETRIDEAMYANLFLMIARLDRRQITAREIDERHEEKLLGLGPVLERQHREKLAVIIRRAYAKVVEQGDIPPLPPEMEGVGVQVDYISTLGQAMKAVATGGMERLYGFIGNLSAVDASVIDKVDNDVAIDEYADMVGVPGNVVRSKQGAGEIRQQRAEQAAAQQQADRAEQVAGTVEKGAKAAQILSQSDTPRGTTGAGNILTQLGLR